MLPPKSLVLLACVLAARPAAAQLFTFDGPDSTRLTLTGRVQAQFNTSDAPAVPREEMVMRRVEIDLGIRLSPLVSGRVQPELAGSRVELKDAFVTFSLDPALTILAGQAYRPFSIVTQMGSARILPVERGLRIRGVTRAYDEFQLVSERGYGERDVGLQLRGDLGRGVTYAAGWFNGPLRAQLPQTDAGQWVARAAVRPDERLRVAASVSTRSFVRADGEGALEMAGGEAWEADVELGTERGGLHLLAEAVYGDFDPFAGAHFFGAHGWLAYRARVDGPRVAAVEPVLRVSYGDPSVEADAEEEVDATGGTLVTPGVNVWLGGLNRISLNYDVWSPEDGEGARSFKAQFQLAF